MGKEPLGISKDDSYSMRRQWEFSRQEILYPPLRGGMGAASAKLQGPDQRFLTV